MCKIEKWMHKHVPEMIDLFVTPLSTVLITAFLTLGLIGPVFSTAESYVLEFAGWIITVGHGVGAMIMGALYPFTVVCGIHHMYNVIEAGMLSAVDGLNIWMPIASAANFAQGAACLAVGLKSKKLKTKSVAIPSALSAALGITEPAIFGVNLRFVKPLICGMAGGAVGALLGSIFQIGATSYGVTGIPGFLITLDYSWQYAIVLVVSFVVSFALTWVVWKEEIEPNENEKKEENQIETSEQTRLEKEELVLFAPIKGNVISRAEIPDETFASGVLGEGVGIDTVHMNGDGFELLVKEGEKVKAGQKLIRFDINKIKAAGYSSTVAVLLTNSEDYSNVQVVKSKKTEQMEKVFLVKK